VLYGTWGRSDGFLRSLLAALRSPWAHGDAATGVAALGVAQSPRVSRIRNCSPCWRQDNPSCPILPNRTARQWDADEAHDSLDRLPGITAPTTVIVGEQDLLTPPKLSRQVAERIPGARLVLVEGVGSSHGMIYERLDEWLEHVREHLRSHARAAQTIRP
jgi:pimeloyl-ACP methyl ester carboxylesterase